MKYLHRAAVLLLFSTTLIGCIEFGEDVWVNADGTGRVKFDISFPEAFISLGKSFGQKDSSDDMSVKIRSTQSRFKSDPRVAAFSMRDTVEGESHHFVFDVSAKKYSDLPDLHSMFFADSGVTTGDNASSGHPSLSLTPSGSTVNFSVTFPRDTGAVDEGSDSLSQAIGDAMLGNHGYSIRLHAPAIGTHNGTYDSVAKTVAWNMSLATMKHPGNREFHATILMPTAAVVAENFYTILWVVIGLVVVLAGVVWWRRK